jgi:beta-carotene 15,15'-dioxygenase
MNYLNSTFFKIQLLAQSVLLVAFFAIPSHQKETFLLAVSAVLLVVVGIPHGANDFLYREEKTFKGGVKFLLAYIGAMLLYAGLWYLLPSFALLLFLVITVHHFGQSNFESQTTWHLPALLWGLWLLAAPISIHLEESTAIFFEMTGGSGAVSWTPIWLTGIRLGLLAVYLLVAWRKYPQVFAGLLLQAALIAIWLEFTPLLSGFIVVFALWHSSQSLYFQWNNFKLQRSNLPQLKIFWLNMALFTAISFGFLYVVASITPLTTALLFMLLAIVTLPHVFVMDHLYQQKTPSPASQKDPMA